MTFSDVLGQQQVFHHVEDEKRAHPVVGETLPHLGREQEGEPARVPEQVRPGNECGSSQRRKPCSCCGWLAVIGLRLFAQFLIERLLNHQMAALRNSRHGGATMPVSRGTTFALSLALTAALAAPQAWAQEAAGYPNKPIRLVVGFAAGGGNDLFARLLGQKLSENVGQPVVIENKPGRGRPAGNRVRHGAARRRLHPRCRC